jgi:energy-converting hydrogenase Eha subunit C
MKEVILKLFLFFLLISFVCCAIFGGALLIIQLTPLNNLPVAIIIQSALYLLTIPAIVWLDK